MLPNSIIGSVYQPPRDRQYGANSDDTFRFPAARDRKQKGSSRLHAFPLIHSKLPKMSSTSSREATQAGLMVTNKCHPPPEMERVPFRDSREGPLKINLCASFKRSLDFDIGRP